MSKFPKLNKTSTEKSAKTVNDAILDALNELGVTKDDVTVEIIDEGKSGFLGFGRRDALVRVSVKESVIAAAQESAAKPAASEKKFTEIKGEKRAPRKTQTAPLKEDAPKQSKKQPKLPPERRNTQKPAQTKPAKIPAVETELTPEKKAEAAKVFAKPEVRHPKKQDMPGREHNERRHGHGAKAEAPRAQEAPKDSAVRTPKKISGIAPPEIAQKFLSDIFAAMRLDIEISAQMESEDALLVNLTGENMGIIIGKRGDTLDSLQYLTSLVINQQTENYIKVTIDTENYREKRSEALLALSSRLADKVAKTGKKFTLEPMNPYERRIIHSNLQDHESVTTFSVGTEPYRKVVIAPKRERGYRKGGFRRYSSNPKRTDAPENTEIPITAEKKGGYTATYKADFKPQQHKAEFKSFDDYLEAHKED